MTTLLRCVLVGCWLLTGLGAQVRLPLDGTWQLRVDQGGKPADTAVAVAVPGAWEGVLGADFDGVAWYERTFALPAGYTGAVRLEFAAVATHATVYVNGHEVGSHLGGWTPFRVDATQAVRRDGQNVLTVRVDEKVGHNTQGFLPIVQPHFGGIWQGVTLCLDFFPTIDRLGLHLFGSWRPIQFGNPPAELAFDVPLLDAAPDDEVTVEVLGTDARATGRRGTLPCLQVTPWSPGSPKLYEARITLRRAGVVADVVTRKVGFRDLQAVGKAVHWNGAPLQMRGILHWGYSPPHFAPPCDPAYWRRQLLDFQSLGFNCVKCCLWVPPRAFYELCDELGLLVWQEYPTWHPKMDQAHKQELLTEYGEFFAHDRSHPSVAFRSITCETGHGADLDVVKALFEACKAAVPNTLVVDDSSWIGWQRITDFWDEHPYGNNSWFPGRLDEFLRHIREKGEKPLLLGECIAADTWLDLAAWDRRHGSQAPWWQPTCVAEQRAFEAWLAAECGAETLASLLPRSLEFGLRNRQFQIEQLRLRIPEAGYVVSVARDIPKCRMGLYDEHDRLKWTPAQWAWHRDTMLCLDLAWHERAVTAARRAVPVRVSHFGQGPLQGTLRLWSDRDPQRVLEVAVEVPAGGTSEPIVLQLDHDLTAAAPITVHAELRGSHPATNSWRLWQVPGRPAAAVRAAHDAEVADAVDDDILVVDRLSVDLLDRIAAGARVLLLAGDRKASPRTEYLWALRGAPFAPDHPLHQRIPKDLWLELSSFDLETGRVMPWDGWLGQVDPVLAFWETHDIPEVRRHLLAFDTRLGEGRLLVTSLRIDPKAGPGTLDHHLRHELGTHLRDGPPAQRHLQPTTVAALRALLTEKRLDLPVWRFRTDPQDEGRAAQWMAAIVDTSSAPWRDLRAGSHWENQAEDLRHYTGVAWYRLDVDVPADWAGLDARAVFDGVDDSFELWLNGEPAGSFGDPVTKTTIWLERQVAELGQRLRAGQRNTLVLRVVDHAGSGGIWKPVFLTTGPADARSKLLH